MKKLFIPLLFVASAAMGDQGPRTLGPEGPAAVPSSGAITQSGLNNYYSDSCGPDQEVAKRDYFKGIKVHDPSIDFYLSRHHSCNNIVRQLNSAVEMAGISIASGKLPQANERIVQLIYEYSERMRDDDFYRDPATVIAITQAEQILRVLNPNYRLYPVNEITDRLRSNRPSIPGRTYTPSNIYQGTLSLLINDLLEIINFAYSEVDARVVDKLQSRVQQAPSVTDSKFSDFFVKYTNPETYRNWSSNDSQHGRRHPAMQHAPTTYNPFPHTPINPLENYDEHHFALAEMMFVKYEKIDGYVSSARGQLDNATAFARSIARVINNTQHRNDYTCIINELYYIADYAQFQKCNLDDFNKAAIIYDVRMKMVDQYNRLLDIQNGNICGGHY